MTIYLSGPMSGKPKLNFEEFDRVAAILRGQGHEVISPAELDEPWMRRAILEGFQPPADEYTWGACVLRDIEALAECDSVVLLDNWQTSRGAKLEVTYAIAHGYEVYKYMRGGNLDLLPYRHLKEFINA